MPSRVDIESRREAKLIVLTRIRDTLERGCWPTGLPLTPREREGLRRAVDAIQDELRRLTDG